MRGWFDDSGELYIQDTTDLNVEEGYLMEYRDGRFGGEVLPYGGFDELDDAMEYAEIILKGKIEVDELLE